MSSLIDNCNPFLYNQITMKTIQTIEITKMQGCGNDFIIIDHSEFKKTYLTMSDLAKRVCNRNFGVGADGMIIPRLDCESADIGWYFYNSDGTTAQMCGNGMRCFAKYVYDKKLVDKKEFSVETLAGIIKPSIQEDGLIKVNMSKPVLEPSKIPYHGQNDLKLTIENKEFDIKVVSMGNPHCVIFTEGDIYNLAKIMGPKIESHKNFPEKTNVEFINVKSKNEMDLCVYERSCGITLACGTGACAGTVAAILNNLTENKVKVNLPGGALMVEWNGSLADVNHDVFLIGPSEYTFFADFIL